MVWPSDKFLAQFSEAWRQVWVMKLNATGTVYQRQFPRHKNDLQLNNSCNFFKKRSSSVLPVLS